MGAALFYQCKSGTMPTDSYYKHMHPTRATTPQHNYDMELNYQSYNNRKASDFFERTATAYALKALDHSSSNANNGSALFDNTNLKYAYQEKTFLRHRLNGVAERKRARNYAVAKIRHTHTGTTWDARLNRKVGFSEKVIFDEVRYDESLYRSVLNYFMPSAKEAQIRNMASIYSLQSYALVEGEIVMRGKAGRAS